MKEPQRIILVGPPRAGKSTYARELRAKGYETFCADPHCLVKEPEPGVTYLDDKYAEKDMWSEASRYVCDHWLDRPGRWVIDGVSTARALRKWQAEREWHVMPADRIVVFTEHHPMSRVTPGQRAMGKGVASVWHEIAERFAPIVEHR